MTEPETIPARRSKRIGTAMGLLALVVVLVTLGLWAQQIRQVDIPANRTLFVIVFLSATALGVAAFVAGTRWFGGFAAVVAIFLGSLVPLTIAVSRQDVVGGAVGVGDVIPHFTAIDEFGEPFDSVALQDRLLLIKFFRAHW